MMNIEGLSQRNLERVQKVIGIVLDELDLPGRFSSLGCSILIKTFEKEGFDYQEVEKILNNLEFVSVRNNELFISELEARPPMWVNLGEGKTQPLFTDKTKEEIRKNIYLEISDTNKLKEVKKMVDEKMKNIKNRAELFNDEGKKSVLMPI